MITVTVTESVYLTTLCSSEDCQRRVVGFAVFCLNNTIVSVGDI